MTCRLKAVVEFSLKKFPHGVAIGFDDHTSFDDFRRLGHIAGDDDILIPGSEVFIARCNWRFRHLLFLAFCQCDSRLTTTPLRPTRKSRSAPLSACMT